MKVHADVGDGQAACRSQSPNLVVAADRSDWTCRRCLATPDNRIALDRMFADLVDTSSALAAAREKV